MLVAEPLNAVAVFAFEKIAAEKVPIGDKTGCSSS